MKNILIGFLLGSFLCVTVTRCKINSGMEFGRSLFSNKTYKCYIVEK